MRPTGRRRPAGLERVPPERVIGEVVDRLVGPLVLRVHPGGGLLDYPAGRPVRRIVSFWPQPQTGGWAEVDWPFDHRRGWFVTPVDLRLGHLVEFWPSSGACPLPCWVARVESDAVVLWPAASRQRCWEAATITETDWVRGRG